MASDTETLVDALTAALGSERVATDGLERYAVDGLVPRVAVTPRSVAEVAQVMAAAARRQAAVVPWGGGAHIALGNRPRRYEVALCLSRLDQVLEYEPADLTVAVQAGITLPALNERLKGSGQFLPLDPPGGEAATIGGILASGASGPLRYAYGTARDWVIGTKVVHADGRVSKSGGRVVKNVAGYDMSKLYIGSLGTLAIIVEVNLKVATLPRQEQTATLTAPSLEQALGLALALHDAVLSLTSMTLLNPAAVAQARASTSLRSYLDSEGYALALRLAGEKAAVGRSLKEIKAICRRASGCRSRLLDEGGAAELWTALRRACRPGAEDDRLLLKASVLPSQVLALTRVWDTLAAAGALAVVSHPAQGVVYGEGRGAPLADGEAAGRLMERLRAAASALGGTAVVEACPPSAKEKIDVWGETRGDFPLMRRLKDEMDPAGVLNPGRFLGGI